MRHTLILLLMSMTAAAAHAQGASIAWSPFSFTSAAGDTVAADSARVVVPENRSRPGGAKIQIAVVRVRSTAARPGAPVVYLAGGPGGAGIAGARGELFPTVLALREVSDVILFDQRGTGTTLPSLGVRATFGVSPELSSASPEAKEVLVSRSRAAAADMRSRGIDLGSYNTIENADDVDDIRKAIGAAKLVLWGHSYGSHLGLAYLRRHPSRAERAILGGINGVDHRRRYPRDTDILFQRIDSAVKANPQLRQVMPDFLGSARRVFAKLAAEPGRARVDSQDVVITKEDAQIVIAILSGEQSIVRRLPWIIGRMEAGDYSWFARQVRDVIKSRPIGTAMTYAMDLASGVSPGRSQRIKSQAGAALLGNAINFPFDDPDFIAAWNVPDLGAEFRTPVKSSVPTLFISGTLDGRTSLGDAEEVRKGFARGVHIIVDGASHNPYAVTPELKRLMVRFVSGGTVRDTLLRAANVEFRGPDETEIIEEIRSIAVETGPATAEEKLRSYARPGSGKYISSFVITGLFQALATSAREAAVAILKVGLELFPRNSLLVTRLAEVHVAMGDKTAAIEAYRKAVSLDPFNQNASVQLKKLSR